MMYELEKSDSLVVPRKSANKAGLLAAEPMEGSGGIARNANLQRTARTQSRTRRVTRADRHTCGCGCIGCASSTRDRRLESQFTRPHSVLDHRRQTLEPYARDTKLSACDTLVAHCPTGIMLVDPRRLTKVPQSFKR